MHILHIFKISLRDELAKHYRRKVILLETALNVFAKLLDGLPERK